MLRCVWCVVRAVHCTEHSVCWLGVCCKLELTLRAYTLGFELVATAELREIPMQSTKHKPKQVAGPDIDNHKAPVGDFELDIDNHKAPVGDFELDIDNHKAPVGDFELDIDDHKAPVGGSKPDIGPCSPQNKDRCVWYRNAEGRCTNRRMLNPRDGC
jgi:hypothetical protein